MIRIRHHINPLNFRKTVDVLDFAKTFAKPELPLDVEIGCAMGEFMLEKAQRDLERNLLGLELRPPLVERLHAMIIEKQLTNAAIINANANAHLRLMVPTTSISDVFIFFPDPWFKNRHIKRRLITFSFLNDLSLLQKPGGRVFIATDVEPLMLYMHEIFITSGKYRSMYSSLYDLQDNLLGITTFFEAKKLRKRMRIFRCVYERIELEKL